MEWTTAVLLFAIHVTLVSAVVAMVWNGPLTKHTVKVADKRKAAEDLKKRLDIIE